MKIQGKIISGPNVELVVIPRPQISQPQVDAKGEKLIGSDGKPIMELVSGDIAFYAQAILNFDNFEKLCPTPKAPTKVVPGGGVSENVEHPDFKKAINAYSTKRFNWIIIESLKATPQLEWDTVKLDDSETWGNYATELTAAGFSQVEIGRIISAVLIANCLDESKLDKARESFLASRAHLLAQ